MTVDHDTLDGSEAHEIGYRQATDPGAVGAGISWIDTSGGTGAWVHKVRNAANDGWETVGSSGGDFTKWDPDAPPASASSYDDEFDDQSFDTGLWSEFDHGSLLTVTEDEIGCKLALAVSSSIDYAGIHQSLQSGDFTYTTKISWNLPKRNMYSHIGLVLFENTTSTGNFLGIFLNTTRTDYNQRITILEMNDYQSFSTEDTYEARAYNDTFIYFRIRYDGTDYHFEWSLDGVGWRWLWSEDDALYSGSPSDIGIVLNCEDSVVGMTGRVELFRYKNSDIGNDGILEGDRVDCARAS